MKRGRKRLDLIAVLESGGYPARYLERLQAATIGAWTGGLPCPVDTHRRNPTPAAGIIDEDGSGAIKCHACGPTWQARELAELLSLDSSLIRTATGAAARRASAPAKPATIDVPGGWPAWVAEAQTNRAVTRYLIGRGFSLELANAVIDAGAVGYKLDDPRPLYLPLWRDSATAPASMMRRAVAPGTAAAGPKRLSNADAGLVAGTPVLLGDMPIAALFEDVLHLGEGELDTLVLSGLREIGLLQGGVLGGQGSGSPKAFSALATLAQRRKSIPKAVYVWTDPDSKGAKYLDAAAIAFEAIGAHVYRVPLPRGCDVNDVLRDEGADALASRLDRAWRYLTVIRSTADAAGATLEHEILSGLELPATTTIIAAPPGTGKTTVKKNIGRRVLAGELDMGGPLVFSVGTKPEQRELELYLQTKAKHPEDVYAVPSKAAVCELQTTAYQTAGISVNCAGCVLLSRCPIPDRRRCAGGAKIVIVVHAMARVGRDTGIIDPIWRTVVDDHGTITEQLTASIEGLRGLLDLDEEIHTELLDLLSDETLRAAVDWAIKRLEYWTPARIARLALSGDPEAGDRRPVRHGFGRPLRIPKESREAWLPTLQRVLDEWPVNLRGPEAALASANAPWPSFRALSALCRLFEAPATTKTVWVNPSADEPEDRAARISVETVDRLITDGHCVMLDASMLRLRRQASEVTAGACRFVDVQVPAKPGSDLLFRKSPEFTRQKLRRDARRRINRIFADIKLWRDKHRPNKHIKVGLVVPKFLTELEGERLRLRSDLMDCVPAWVEDLSVLYTGNVRGKNDLENCDVTVVIGSSRNLDAMAATAQTLRANADEIKGALQDTDAEQAIGRARLIRRTTTVFYYAKRRPPVVHGLNWQEYAIKDFDVARGQKSTALDWFKSDEVQAHGLLSAPSSVLRMLEARDGHQKRQQLRGCGRPTPLKQSIEWHRARTTLESLDKGSVRRALSALKREGVELHRHEVPQALVRGGAGGRAAVVWVIKDSFADKRLLDLLTDAAPLPLWSPTATGAKAGSPMAQPSGIQVPDWQEGSVEIGRMLLAVGDSYRAPPGPWTAESKLADIPMAAALTRAGSQRLARGKPTPMKHHNDSPAPIGVFGFVTPDTRTDDAEPPSPRTVELCKQWLASSWPQRVTDSYALKHLVEQWCGEYIPNGALLAAAIELGIPVQRDSGQNGRLVPGLLMAG